MLACKSDLGAMAFIQKQEEKKLLYMSEGRAMIGLNKSCTKKLYNIHLCCVEIKLF